MGIANVCTQRSSVSLRVVAAIASVIWASMMSNGGFALMPVRTIAPGPVGYWTFNEGNGTTVTDSTGNGNTGILVGGPVWMSGGECKGGACLRFNGSTSRVDVTNSASLTTSAAFTVTFWYKSTTNAGSIAAKPFGIGTLNSWQLEFASGNLSFTSSDGNTQALDTVAAPAAGNWVFVSATWDGATKKLYLDGAQKIAVSRSIVFDASNMVIGGDYNAGTFVLPYSGVVDEFQVYDRALTASEILELYNINGPDGDSVVPSVTLTAPSPDTTVSGANLMVSADASDNVAVTGVQFKLDGVDLGPEETSAPYSFAWNTTSAANGPHWLSAVARDAAGNTGVARAMVTVANPSGGTFQEILVANGLGTPTSMEFAPDGRLFVAEQAGRLRVIENGSLLPVPFVTLSVTSDGERGLLGIAFDPDFAANRYIYLYYTTANSPVMNRVSRFTASLANPDAAEPGSEVVILDNIPCDGLHHNGGAIHFGLDRKLYIGVGDGGSDATKAQRLDTLSGKLLRINTDGTVPSDNPFVGSAGARGEIWSLGLRNPFTFAVDPQGGKIHINDVGESTWEEIDLAAKGANYGWPTCEGFCTDSRFVNPIHAYSHAVGQAITGGAFYRATQYPAEFFGSYFFSDYLGRWIKRLDAGNQVLDFLSPNGGPVDLKVGPDGTLYYLAISGSVSRVQYNPTSDNGIPTASFTAAPASGAAPLSVNFDATGSTDPDGDALTYSWNFGDGSPTATGVTVSHVYQNQGAYTASLTVNDGRGGTATATRQIAVSTIPPSRSPVPVTWTSLVNATVTDSVLRKTSACNGCADSGAISQQTIASGDGYVEFTVAETGTSRFIGLSNGNPGTTTAEIKFALSHIGSYIEVRESGVYKADRPYAVGDVFRIAVLGGRVTYSKNGMVFYTSSDVPTYPLLVDTALLGVNASLSNVVILNGSITPPPPSPPVISSVNASAAAASAAISWNTDVASDSQVEYGTTTAYGSSTTLNTTPGTAHSQTIEGLLPNTLYHYRVRSGNAQGVAISDDFTFTTTSASAAVPVIWTSLVNANVTGSVLRKTSACNGCADSGAISQQTIASGDGYVEFTVAETGTSRFIGLSNGNPGTTTAEIKFALSHIGSNIEVRESGVYKSDRPYAVGDVFRIAVLGGRVTYSKNGTVFYTSSDVPTYPLLVDTALLGVNASLSNVVILNASITPPSPSPPAISNVNVSAATTFEDPLQVREARLTQASLD